jgi:hypothetical protein
MMVPYGPCRISTVHIELCKTILMMTSHCDRSGLTVLQDALWYNMGWTIILFFE